MSDELNRAIALPLAERIATLTRLAAGAEEREKDLEEALRESEYLRVQAETTLATLTMDGMPYLWHVANGAPPAPIQSLFSLATGSVWRRRFGDQWTKLEANSLHDSYQDWPLEDQGPLIALEEDWNLERLQRDATATTAAIVALRRTIHQKVREFPEPGAVATIAKAQELIEQLLPKAHAWDRLATREGLRASVEEILFHSLQSDERKMAALATLLDLPNLKPSA